LASGKYEYSLIDFSQPSLFKIDRLRTLLESPITKAIINYVRQNPNTTVDKVAKQLQKEKVCSRLTTLSMIEKLRVIDLIKDDRRGKYFHSLSINEHFEIKELASMLFKTDIRQNLRIFDKFVFGDNIPTEAQVKQLHDSLDEAIDEHYTITSYKVKGPISISELRKQKLKKKRNV